MKILKEVEPDRVGPEDITAEGLITHMRRKNAKGKPKSKLILPMEEFGQYLAASKGYASNLSSVLCKLYDGSDYERARSGKKLTAIVAPRVSIFGAVAYGMMEKFSDPQDWITGFFARFLFVTPQNRPNSYPVQPPTPKTERDNAVAALADLRNELRSSPGPMVTTQQAEHLFMVYASTITEDPDPVKAAVRQRYLNAVWKIAMLYQIDDNPQHPIGPQAMSNAIQYIEAAWRSFTLVYGVTSGDEFARVFRRIWKAVSNAGPNGIARSTLLKNHNVAAAMFRAVTDLLLANQAIDVRKEPGKTKPREIFFCTQEYED